MDKQIVQPDLSIIGRITYCLEYARKVFGAPLVELTAWDAWKATKYKHLDRNLPDVAVPVWFSYRADLGDGLKDYGHVVVWVPGKGFYSSPWDRKVGFNILGSIESVEQHYSTAPKTASNGKVSFVGWSGDISNVRVVEIGDDMVKLTYTEVVDAYKAFAGYPPSEAVLNWAVEVDAREVYLRILSQEQAPNYPFLKDRYEEGDKNFVEVTEKLYRKK